MASSAKKKIYDFEKMKTFRRWVPWNPRTCVAETAFHALGRVVQSWVKITQG